MNETVTVYITKYALTNGIIKCSEKICHEVFSPDNRRKLNMWIEEGFTSKEYVLTETEAQKVFEEKRLKAIKQTERKLEELKTLEMQIKEY